KITRLTAVTSTPALGRKESSATPLGNRLAHPGRLNPTIRLQPDRPVALSSCRRLICILFISLSLFESASPTPLGFLRHGVGGKVNRSLDPRIGSAAAQIAGHGCINILVGGMGVLGQ